MKKIAVLMLFILSSCENQSATGQRAAYSTFIIGNFFVTLADRDGKCTLIYTTQAYWGFYVTKTADLGMAAPCEYIRVSDNMPQMYAYREGSDAGTVLLVTGGKPSTTMKDKFLPHGCGTQLAKVRVFSDRVTVVPAVPGDGPPYCPSTPVDEVLFAA